MIGCYYNTPYLPRQLIISFSREGNLMKEKVSKFAHKFRQTYDDASNILALIYKLLHSLNPHLS
jgi:hypothetical protein